MQPDKISQQEPAHDKLWTFMGAGGEVRLKACRYGGGFMCVIALVESDDRFWERWEDMCGGDPEYIAASDYLENEDNQRKDSFGFGYGRTPHEALASAERVAIVVYEGIKAEFRETMAEIERRKGA